MLFALVLALIGAVALLLLGRASAGETAAARRVEELIDLAVRDAPAARRLLREHPELLSARTIQDATPLHFCAVEGLTEGVRFLADAGVPLEARNELGDTALVDTVTRGDLGMSRLLLRLGADPNAASRLRGSALHIAVGQGSPELAAALLDAGARADYVTDRGERIWDAVSRAGPGRQALLGVLEAHGLRP